MLLGVDSTTTKLCLLCTNSTFVVTSCCLETPPDAAKEEAEPPPGARGGVATGVRLLRDELVECGVFGSEPLSLSLPPEPKPKNRLKLNSLPGVELLPPPPLLGVRCGVAITLAAMVAVLFASRNFRPFIRSRSPALKGSAAATGWGGEPPPSLPLLLRLLLLLLLI